MWLYVPNIPEPASLSAEASSVSISESGWFCHPFSLWVLSSGKPTQQASSQLEWKKVPWIERLWPTISRPSMAERYADAWILSLRDSLASPQASQDSAEEPTTSAGSGRMSGGSSERPELGGCSLKTCPVCSLPTDSSLDAYVAGLIDGEGSIVLTRSAKLRASVQVRMSTKATNLISILAGYGGTAGIEQRDPRPNTSAIALWRIASWDAACFLRRILPHLRLKRAQAEIVLSLHPLGDRPERNAKTKWDAERLATWEAAREKMVALNARGQTTPDPSVVAQLVGRRWISRVVEAPGVERWEPFSATWTRAGSVRNGIVSQRQPSVPRTSEIVGSCWLP